MLALIFADVAVMVTRNMGSLIVIEGLDGSGKTTLIRGLGKYLKKLGFRVVMTSEPTSGPIGRIIKRYLRGAQRRDPIYEALMFAADRRWHCENVIRPALKKGSIVLCDRYVFSSLAYQAATGLDEKWIMAINKFAIEPNIAFFLDAPPDVCKRRLAKRHPSILEGDDAQRAAYEVYTKLVERGMLIRIDATADRSAVLKAAIGAICERRMLASSA